MIKRERFALYLFEMDRDDDRELGLSEGENEEYWAYPDTWEELAEDEKELYLKEADHYLALPRTDWPTHVIKKAKEGLEDERYREQRADLDDREAI